MRALPEYDMNAEPLFNAATGIAKTIAMQAFGIRQALPPTSQTRADMLAALRKVASEFAINISVEQTIDREFFLTLCGVRDA